MSSRITEAVIPLVALPDFLSLSLIYIYRSSNCWKSFIGIYVLLSPVLVVMKIIIWIGKSQWVQLFNIICAKAVSNETLIRTSQFRWAAGHVWKMPDCAIMKLPCSGELSCRIRRRIMDETQCFHYFLQCNMKISDMPHDTW